MKDERKARRDGHYEHVRGPAGSCQDQAQAYVQTCFILYDLMLLCCIACLHTFDARWNVQYRKTTACLPAK